MAMSQSEKVIEFRKRIKSALVEAFGKRCFICGQEYPECVFDFHHIVPEEKSFNISSSSTKAKDEYATEAEKCCILCANCHRRIENELIDSSELRCTFNKDVYYETINLLSQRAPKKTFQNVNTLKPDRETLKQLIRTTPFTQIGKQFLVTDNSVRKWCVKYGLPSRVSDIRSIPDSDWVAI